MKGSICVLIQQHLESVLCLRTVLHVTKENSFSIIYADYLTIVSIIFVLLFFPERAKQQIIQKHQSA